MQVYMVERSLKGISMADLGAAQSRAIETSKRFTRDGKPVEYIRSTFVPDEGRCMCLCSADSAESVKAVNDQAKIPYDRVVAAMDLRP